METIPKKIQSGVPKKCPKCLKNCITVFRLFSKKKVYVEFLHDDGSSKMCKKTYLDIPFKILKSKKK